MNANATAISLNLDQVKLILQDWLNANLLRTPHQVLDLDFVGDRLVDTQVGQFNIILAPIALAPIVPTGNGKEVPPPATKMAADSKRRRFCTADDKAEILRLRAAGMRPSLIATTVGFSEAVIFRIIKEHAEATHAA